jgi:hypothetical protein
MLFAKEEMGIRATKITAAIGCWHNTEILWGRKIAIRAILLLRRGSGSGSGSG